MVPIGDPGLAGPKRQGELWLQYCGRCERYIYYPRDLCPNCLNTTELEWRKAAGTGKVYSYCIIRRNPLPAFRELVPYIFAVVELAEGPRLITNIINCSLEQVAIGMPVKIDQPQQPGTASESARKGVRVVFSPLNSAN